MLLISKRIVREDTTGIRREKNSVVTIICKIPDTQEIKFEVRNKENRMKFKSIRDRKCSRKSYENMSSIMKSHRDIMNRFKVGE